MPVSNPPFDKLRASLHRIYDHAVETVLHCRCTVCCGWWHLDNAPTDKPYWCPHCGTQLDPAQYPEDRPPIATGAVDL